MALVAGVWSEAVGVGMLRWRVVEWRFVGWGVVEWRFVGWGVGGLRWRVVVWGVLEWGVGEVWCCWVVWCYWVVGWEDFVEKCVAVG